MALHFVRLCRLTGLKTQQPVERGSGWAKVSCQCVLMNRKRILWFPGERWTFEARKEECWGEGGSGWGAVGTGSTVAAVWRKPESAGRGHRMLGLRPEGVLGPGRYQMTCTVVPLTSRIPGGCLQLQIMLNPR